MPSEKDHLAIQKATVYDLEKLVEQNPNETMTKDEIKALMDAYIKGAEQ